MDVIEVEEAILFLVKSFKQNASHQKFFVKTYQFSQRNSKNQLKGSQMLILSAFSFSPHSKAVI